MLEQKADALQSPPLFVYIGTDASAALGVGLTNGRSPSKITILLTDIIADSCAPGAGAKFLSKPRLIGKDGALFRFHQGFERSVYAIDVALSQSTNVGYMQRQR